METRVSARALRIGSVINIVMGIAEGAFGALTVAAATLLDTSRILQMTELARGMERAGIPADHAGLLLGLLGVLVMAAGILTTITGCFGVRASSDASRIRPVWVLSIASLVLGVASIALAVAAGMVGLGVVASTAACVIVFWAANDIRRKVAAQATGPQAVRA